MSRVRGSAVQRSAAWQVFVVLHWLFVGLALVIVASLAYNAWTRLHPVLIPWTEMTPSNVDDGDNATVALSLGSFLAMTFAMPVALAALATGFAAIGSRSHGARSRRSVLATLIIASVVGPWLIATEPWADDSPTFSVGPAYWLAGATAELSLLVALVLVAYLLIRPRADLPTPPPVPRTPAGWYPDPSGVGQWRWWDGNSWAREASRAP